MPQVSNLAVYLAVFLSALAFVISVFSFFYFRQYLRRRTGQEQILSELREEVDKILRSIDETTDRDISLIEEREKTLRGLLEEIDKRLKLYIRELENRREADETYAALRSKAQGLSYQELGKNRHFLAAAGTGAVATAGADEPTAAAAAVAPAAEIPAEPSSPPPPPSAALPAGEQIRELVRAGFSPAVIASRLGLSITEVEVVTALMERRAAR